MPVFTNNIIEDLQKGVVSAERELFDSTIEKMFPVALRLVGDVHTANDVLQEAYIRIYANIDRVELIDTAHSLSWMRTVVIRESLRWIKRNKRYRERLSFLDSRKEAIMEFPGAAYDLNEILNTLPDMERTIFTLAAIESYDHKYISESLGISATYSRVILSRARKKLKIVLKNMRNYETAK